MKVVVTSDPAHIDVDQVFEWLQTTYWADTRTREEQETGMVNSLNYGAFVDNQMVGYARVVTDYATFGWLCDVYVTPESRGQGVARALLDSIFSDPKVAQVKRMLLGTRYAHGLYRKYDFTDTEPGRIMRRGFKDLTKPQPR